MATQRLLSLPGEIGNPRERVEQPVRKSNAVNPAAPRSNRVSRQAGAPVRFERRKAQTPERSAPDRCVEWGGTSASDERPRCCAGLPRGWGLSHVPAGGSRTGAVGERDIGVARCFPATLGFLPGSAVCGLRAGCRKISSSVARPFTTFDSGRVLLQGRLDGTELSGPKSSPSAAE